MTYRLAKKTLVDDKVPCIQMFSVNASRMSDNDPTGRMSHNEPIGRVSYNDPIGRVSYNDLTGKMC